jgi:hypothetical protein
MFETYYNQLMKMKKAEIARQGAAWGVISDNQSTLDYMVKTYTKIKLARYIAGRKDWEDSFK